MNAWDIFTWNFPDAGRHPAVILGTDERLKHKPKVNVLLCSSQRATRRPELHEVILDQSDVRFGLRRTDEATFKQTGLGCVGTTPPDCGAGHSCARLCRTVSWAYQRESPWLLYSTHRQIVTRFPRLIGTG